MPTGTNIVMAIDIARMRDEPHFAALYEMTLREWFGDFLGELTTECHVDPIRSVDQIVVGGLGPLFLYRSAVVTGLDRAQMTSCLSDVSAKARAAGVELRVVPFDGGIELQSPGDPPMRIGFLDDRTVVVVREQGHTAERDVLTRITDARAGDGASADAALMAAVDRAASDGTAWMVVGGSAVAAYGVPAGTNIHLALKMGEQIDGRWVAVGPNVDAKAAPRIAAGVQRKLLAAARDPDLEIPVHVETVPGGIAVVFSLPPVALASLIESAAQGSF
jgi:hypothetical protein